MSNPKHSCAVLCDLEDGRLIMHDYAWDGYSSRCCVHGIKLRWRCEWCDDYVNDLEASDE